MSEVIKIIWIFILQLSNAIIFTCKIVKQTIFWIWSALDYIEFWWPTMSRKRNSEFTYLTEWSTNKVKMLQGKSYKVFTCQAT